MLPGGARSGGGRESLDSSKGPSLRTRRESRPVETDAALRRLLLAGLAEAAGSCELEQGELADEDRKLTGEPRLG